MRAVVSKSLVRETINQFGYILIEQSDFVETIGKEVAFLTEVWEAPSEEAYEVSFGVAKKGAEDFYKALKDYVKTMEDFVSDLEKFDDELAGKLTIK